MADNNTPALDAILALLPTLSDDEKATVAGELDTPQAKYDTQKLLATIPRGIGR